ncbi:MAG: lipoyl(octanoyl) transferase [Chloroflexi bacterium RBG_16_48_7]|nr:MAG: lipoyl(octanoyl) transferase [Chloroflexi bacterium RBG_16_48_7]
MIKSMESQQPGTCLVCQLGLVTFPEAMEFEHRLIELRFEEKIGDILLIFEHPPTITLGKYGNKGNVLMTPEELEQRGIAFYDSDRGGDATFNCPGQLVVHPIMNLRLMGARAYIADLEEMCLRVLRDYGIAAERLPQHPGIWINSKQIGAIGLRFSRGISMHGLSLNVNPDLASFKVINLCGLPGRTATSIENELGHVVSIAEVNQRVLNSFSNVFHVDLLSVSKEQLKKDCFEPQTSKTV